MNVSRKIPNLFFVNYDEIREKRENKLYSRISKVALWIWVSFVLPITVWFSIEISSFSEIYNPTKKVG